MDEEAKGRDKTDAPDDSGYVPERRSFLKGVTFAAGAVTLWPTGGQAEDSKKDQNEPEDASHAKILKKGEHQIRLRINGEERTVTVEPRSTLLDALRMKLGLTGPKEICDRGSCGGCTVLMDGAAVCSCMTLAVDAVDHEVTTIEGLAADPRFAGLIDAYCENDAAQCGYCIPGFVVRSAEVLENNPDASDEELREGLAGNICRCGTYEKIFDALAQATGRGGQS